MLAALVVLVLVACGGSDDPAVADSVDVETPAATAAPAEAPTAGFEPTAAPPDATTAPAPTAEPAPTDEPAPAVTAPACEDVPTFYAADSVDVACAGAFALAPELFANNAGWHLFEATDGEWVEVDFALTCCNEPDEIPLIELLQRNGLDATTVTELCASAGGCDVGQSATPSDFDTGALRVDGFAEHDFGADETDVRNTLAAGFGEPIDVFDAEECGAGPMTLVSYDEFTINFQDGFLIGWFYTSSSPALTTPSGVEPGIDEATLRTSYPGVEIDETTLGVEFFYEVPSGFMAGFLEDGIVTSLYAGTNCFFR